MVVFTQYLIRDVQNNRFCHRTNRGMVYNRFGSRNILFNYIPGICHLNIESQRYPETVAKSREAPLVWLFQSNDSDFPATGIVLHSGGALLKSRKYTGRNVVLCQH
jgi:hypothetical protein